MGLFPGWDCYISVHAAGQRGTRLCVEKMLLNSLGVFCVFQDFQWMEEDTFLLEIELV